VAVRHKSIVGEARQIELASQLIRFGARMQVLESETSLSRERLLRLYKEIQGKSPPKGMLPFSTDWFMTWQPNVHASLYMNIHQAVINGSALEDAEALIASYGLYLEQIDTLRLEPVLSLTRAWRLLKFCDCNLLTLAACKRCGGQFVVHSYDLVDAYVCGLCHLPSRAGKTHRAVAMH
jgi:flagellar transcriptional activator FlhC